MTTNRMAAKAWLQRAHKIDEEIALMQERIEAWRDLATLSTQRTEERFGVSSRTRLEDYVIKIADAQAEIERQMAKLLQVKREIENMINFVSSSRLRVLLQRRYLFCESWKSISYAMNFSEKYIIGELHKEALDAVAQIMKCA